MYNQNQQQNKEYLFFLFVNTGSGGNVGSKLLQQQVQRIQFILPIHPQVQNSKCYLCSVFIYNMRVNRQEGFKRLRKQSQQGHNQCYAIVCGGDGTVMWVVTELVKFGIKPALVPIGVIPLGTGNDFSRQLGWGYQKSNLLDSGFKNLKKQIRKWLNARIQYFDLWDVQTETFQDGKFQKVKGKLNELLPGNTYKRTFCNYFSFGIDGKIGYSFDMHRTSTRLGNLTMYACLGMVKTLSKTKSLDQLLQKVQINKSNKQTMKKSSLNHQSSQSQQTKHSIVIKHQDNSKSKQSPENQIYFKKNYYNILALNINSYTGGVKDIWQNAGNGFVKNMNNQDYQQVSTCDGKLQIVSFGSSFGIAMERFLGGMAKKMTQGEGPFIFYFQRYENRPKHRTYLQIDGQFIRFTNPKSLTLKHSDLVPKGKIKVLRNIQKR